MSGFEAMIEEVRFGEDSPLEGNGFEMSVPRCIGDEPPAERVFLHSNNAAAPSRLCRPALEFGSPDRALRGIEYTEPEIEYTEPED
jgi:hypothetical protein